MKFKSWSPEEDYFLRNNYQELGAVSCAAHLGRSTVAIRARGYRLGIQLRQAYEPYTNEEDDFILNSYGKMEFDEMAVVIGRSTSSIRQRARALRKLQI